ncbi:MAG TPA: GNAT family N-acetyltransferase [Vicinamibacterales bacterium]|nr:GNAT family N-acetyltransferase [Vicinamibacterales bacterium]
MTPWPVPQPTLTTARLILRPFTAADAPDVQRYVSEREVAAMTLSIPHPYPDGAAEQWIGTHAAKYAEGQLASFAITERETRALVGAIGLHPEPPHNRAELGYWIGKPFWGRGYATEAAEAIIGFGFEALGLNKIHAAYFLNNPASARVIEKLGMAYEGHLREHDLKWGVYEDIKVHAILAREWAARREQRPR